MLIIDFKTGAEKATDSKQLAALAHLWLNSKGRKGTRDQFRFDKLTHTYYLKDRVLPNVTRVLQLISPIKYVPREALDRGSYLHKALEMYQKRTLSLGGLTGEAREIVLKWHDFLRNWGLLGERSMPEVRMWSSKWYFAGTADLIFPDFGPGENLVWSVYLETSPMGWRRVCRSEERVENFSKFLELLGAYNQMKEAGTLPGE